MIKKYKWHQLILFILGLMAIAAVTIYIIMVYGKIEAEIPTHFNYLGEADAYGCKTSLIVHLMIGWGLYAVITVIGAIPAVWNTGIEVTEKNRDKVYSIIRTMLSILAFAIATFFSFTVFCSAQGKNLPAVALLAFLILVFGTIIISVIRLVRNK